MYLYEPYAKFSPQIKIIGTSLLVQLETVRRLWHTCVRVLMVGMETDVKRR